MPAGDRQSAVGGDGVVVLRWPLERERVEQLLEGSVALLLLVAPNAEPPAPMERELVDWVRLPADPRDVEARRAELERRAAQLPPAPCLREFGELTHRDERVFLSPSEEEIASALVASFDRPVSEAELRRRIRSGERVSSIRMLVYRLRKRIDPLGLEITSIRGLGYRMHERSGPESSSG